MNETNKTKEQLVQELAQARQRIAALEAEAERARTQDALVAAPLI